MNNAELKEYLNTFPDEADVTAIVCNPRKRKRYDVVNVIAITDMEQPIFCIEIGKEGNMDEPDESLTGQMEITDFPEVLP